MSMYYHYNEIGLGKEGLVVLVFFKCVIYFYEHHNSIYFNFNQDQVSQ